MSVFCLNDEPLKKHTTFKIGGLAKKIIFPDSVKDFQNVMSDINLSNEKFFILGGGSNVVFSDNGFDGTIISTQKMNKISLVQKDENHKFIRAECGASVSAIVNFLTENKVSGFEKFAGLPGTIGGAVYMNARCFDLEIADVLDSVEYLDLENLNVCEYKFKQEDWAYKKSPFQKTPAIILSAVLRFENNINLLQEELKEKCAFYINERKEKGHFKFPSAGSVFKNNRDFGKPSGKIIDEANLRGYKIGDAQIAPFHGNFIINLGNATADNVKELVNYTKKIVKEKFGFELEEEIIFV